VVSDATRGRRRPVVGRGGIGALLSVERREGHMPFVTTLTLQSGDRDVLECVVGDIKSRAERKGVEMRGPHAESPADKSVPQTKRLSAVGGQYQPWRYTVYERRMEIVGHDEFARDVAERELPRGVHLDVDVERVSAPGSR
jgi:ribosomal protein S10